MKVRTLFLAAALIAVPAVAVAEEPSTWVTQALETIMSSPAGAQAIPSEAAKPLMTEEGYTAVADAIAQSGNAAMIRSGRDWTTEISNVREVSSETEDDVRLRTFEADAVENYEGEGQIISRTVSVTVRVEQPATAAGSDDMAVTQIIAR